MSKASRRPASPRDCRIEPGQIPYTLLHTPATELNLHLTPHLRELCSILAAGIVRLRCRTAEDFARDAAQAGPDGESSLPFTAHQSGHADAPSRRHA